MGYRESLAELELVTDAEFAKASGMSLYCVRTWVAKRGIAHFVLEGTKTLMLSGSHAVEMLEAKKSEMVAHPSKPRLSGKAKDNVTVLVNRFLDEWTCEAGLRIPASEIYSAYIHWCNIEGVAPASKQKLGRAMTAYGYGTECDASVYYRNGLNIPSRAEINEMVRHNTGLRGSPTAAGQRIVWEKRRCP